MPDTATTLDKLGGVRVPKNNAAGRQIGKRFWIDLFADENGTFSNSDYPLDEQYCDGDDDKLRTLQLFKFVRSILIWMPRGKSHPNTICGKLCDLNVAKISLSVEASQFADTHPFQIASPQRRAEATNSLDTLVEKLTSAAEFGAEVEHACGFLHFRTVRLPGGDTPTQPTKTVDSTGKTSVRSPGDAIQPDEPEEDEQRHRGKDATVGTDVIDAPEKDATKDETFVLQQRATALALRYRESVGAGVEEVQCLREDSEAYCTALKNLAARKRITAMAREVFGKIREDNEPAEPSPDLKAFHDVLSETLPEAHPSRLLEGDDLTRLFGAASAAEIDCGESMKDDVDKFVKEFKSLFGRKSVRFEDRNCRLSIAPKSDATSQYWVQAGTRDTLWKNATIPPLKYSFD